jgi:transposase
MSSRLHVGIDPAKRECVAVVVDEMGTRLGRSIHFAPTSSGVQSLVQRVKQRAPEAERHFFVEASGYLWYAPVAQLHKYGERVSLLSTGCTSRQRAVLSNHAKSDALDAEAAARAPMSIGPKAYHPADIPEGPRLNLRMLCRHRYALVQEATAIKLRIIAWLGLTTPGLTDVLGTDLSAMDREFIRRYPVVARLSQLGRERVRQFLQRRSADELEPELVDELFELVEEAYSPQDLDDRLVAWQIGLELDRLMLLERQIKQLEGEADKLLAEYDPQGLARSIPGFGRVVAPILVAEADTDVSRFADAAHFASWTGLVGRARSSAGKQVEGMPITKAGRSIVKWALYMAASTAIQRDPELKAFYDRLRANGKHHIVAVTAVAHKLARIYWAVMTEQRRYQVRVPADPGGGQPDEPEGGAT